MAAALAAGHARQAAASPEGRVVPDARGSRPALLSGATSTCASGSARFATYNGSDPERTPAAFAIIPYVQARFGGWYVRGGLQRDRRGRFDGSERNSASGSVSERRSPGRSPKKPAGIWATARSLTWSCATKMCSPPTRASSRARRGTDSAARGSTPCRSRSPASCFISAWPASTRVSTITTSSSPTTTRRSSGRCSTRSGRRTTRRSTCASIPRPTPTVRRRVARTGSCWWNAPPLDPACPLDWSTLGPAYAERILDQLEGRWGFTGLRGAISVQEMFTPADFQTRYLAHGGALYGFASHGTMSAFRRPSIQPPGTRNFFFVGGSTHPGGGLPLVALGGKMVAERIIRQWSL